MAGKDDKDKTELPKKWEDWKAPWEVDDDGKDIPADDQKIEPEKLKKYLHGLLSDKGRLRTRLDETTSEKEELQQAVAEATDPEKIKKLQEQNAALIKERDDARSGSALTTLKYKVALEKGLTRRQAERLVGSTEDELAEDADELLKEFGHTGGRSKREREDGGEDENDRPNPRSAPRRPRGNAGDPEDEDDRREREGRDKKPDRGAFLKDYLASTGRG